MNWQRHFAKLGALFRGSNPSDDLEEEIRTHLEMEEQENRERGMTPEEARYAALRKFGNVTRVKEETREMWCFVWLETLLQDLRYGLRQLRRNPGVTFVAVLTLALGIGANTAIFSVVNAVLLRPLPYPDSDRLVSVMEAGPGTGHPVSYPNFFDWQAENHVFSGMASYNYAQFILSGAGQAVHVQALTVSSGLFRVLKVKPLLGRGFEPRDDERGGNVVVLSHILWRQRFNSDPSIVGQNITLSGRTFTVIGVMPMGFQFPPDGHEALWTSVAVDREAGSNIMTGRDYCTLSVIARLKPGVGLAKAQTDMDLIARRLAQQYPETNARQTTVRIVPEIDRVVGSVRLPLLLILGVVAGVLLIACANVANLSLARNLARQKEIAVRAALGAHRARVCRQLLTESLLLSLLGGVAGIAIAAWGTQTLVRLAPEDLPRIAEVGLDLRVLSFAMVLSFVTAVIFGVVPAVQASKINLVDSLKEAGLAGSQAVPQRRLRSALVVAETALTLVLLAGAGLLISSYVRLVHANPGFDPDNLLTFSVDLPSPPYTSAGVFAFTTQMLSRLSALPRVHAAAADWALPFSGDNPAAGVLFEGRTLTPGHIPVARVDTVTPDYFRTMGIPLLLGRFFTDADTAKSLPVAIVNDAFARKYFPNETAVGKRIMAGISATSATPWREIVGVVGNVKLDGLAGNFQPEYYLPFAQFPGFNAFVLRVHGNPANMAPAVRTVVASMDRNVPVYHVETMNDYLSASVARNRFSTLLLGLFGALALALAAVGIYGVISYSVSQTTHEIGIRVALGAEKNDVLKMVVGQGLKLALIGVAIGVAGALALTRFLASLLYGVKPTDPLTFLAVSLILIAVALAACYFPARRAAKVDPMVALHYE